MKRTSLAFEAWPVADQSLWRSLTASGHVLDQTGLGAHWRPATRNILRRDYGFWLAFLQTQDVDLEAEDPVTRFTRARVRGYTKSLSTHAASTQAGAIRSLDVILRRSAPAADWTWLRDIRRPLDAAERRLQGARRRHRIVSSNKLYDLGIALMERASAVEASAKHAVMFRDGLIISLLASRPMRLANLSNIDLERHLVRLPNGEIQIDFAAEETKTGRPFEVSVPASLCAAFDLYLTFYRPILLGRHAHDQLWIGWWGRPLSYHHLGLRITELTQKAFGVAVSPHLFRTAAATTIAAADPHRVGTATAILGHADPRTAERYYNQARSIDAGRAYHKVIHALREQTRPLKRRNGGPT
ncbi:MAG: site-specific integrase [Hyphomicrobiales bacterium]|nr:MAG: site-specific integrase [Hyphomicrobiales bacterium]